MIMDLKDLCYGSPMEEYEYMRILMLSIVGTVSNGYNRMCPLPRIGVSLRHVDKVPREKALEHTRLINSSMAREFSHGKLINT